MYVAAIDQGTTSSRCIIFDHDANVVAIEQQEFRQILPRPGWVEHDAEEIWSSVQKVVGGALRMAGLASEDIRAIGITNQRETTLVWDRTTGRSYGNVLVWQDTRTAGMCEQLALDGGLDRFRATTGLPIATYFSATKLRWILDHVPGASEAAERGDALCGTIDSYLVWRLTGGVNNGVHITDVSNASRTLLMNLNTLDWDPEILAVFGIQRSILPAIRSSSEVYGEARELLPGVPIAGILGDQQAALVGQTCFNVGDAKNTYGTGCFMLLNTGEQAVQSQHGLLTTIGYKFGDAPAVYALEGSIAFAGALVQWLRDNLGIINNSTEIEALANSVEDNGGCYIVPAFSGLFAPRWRADARGIIAGLTRFNNRGHLARAALEAVCYQAREVLEAMNSESGSPLSNLKVDGGMTANDTLMQLQADILGLEVVRPRVRETTALGAAYAAGLATGVWSGLDELRANWHADRRWQPHPDDERRAAGYREWNKAVERTLNWVD